MDPFIELKGGFRVDIRQVFDSRDVPEWKKKSLAEIDRNFRAHFKTQNVKLPVAEIEEIDLFVPKKKKIDAGESYIVYKGKTAEEYNKTIEYDMDSEVCHVAVQDGCLAGSWNNDMNFLSVENGRRGNEGEAPLTETVFEMIIDRIEKASSFQARNGETPENVAGDTSDDVCCVCYNGDVSNTNQIIYCDMCNVAVHQDCYGVPYIPDGQWLCRRCKLSPSAIIKCDVCHYQGGAFKQTTEGGWAHVICAIWLNECSFANLAFLEPIDGVAHSLKRRAKLKCLICRKKGGACIQCSSRSCVRSFHVTCARLAGLQMEQITKKDPNNPDDVNVQRFVYCHIHCAEPIPDRQFAKTKETVIDLIRRASEAGEKGSACQPILLPQLTPVARAAIENEVGEDIERIVKFFYYKRLTRSGMPLIRRIQVATSNSKKEAAIRSQKNDIDKGMLANQKGRATVERGRLLCEMTKKREKDKLRNITTSHLLFKKLVATFNVTATTIIKKVATLDKYKVFAKPVTVEGYASIIRNPMDINTISTKNDSGSYKTLKKNKYYFDYGEKMRKGTERIFRAMRNLISSNRTEAIRAFIPQTFVHDCECGAVVAAVPPISPKKAAAKESSIKRPHKKADVAKLPMKKAKTPKKQEGSTLVKTPKTALKSWEKKGGSSSARESKQSPRAPRKKDNSVAAKEKGTPKTPKSLGSSASVKTTPPTSDATSAKVEESPFKVPALPKKFAALHTPPSTSSATPTMSSNPSLKRPRKRSESDDTVEGQPKRRKRSGEGLKSPDKKNLTSDSTTEKKMRMKKTSSLDPATVPRDDSEMKKKKRIKAEKEDGNGEESGKEMKKKRIISPDSPTKKKKGAESASLSGSREVPSEGKEGVKKKRRPKEKEDITDKKTKTEAHEQKDSNDDVPDKEGVKEKKRRKSSLKESKKVDPEKKIRRKKKVDVEIGLVLNDEEIDDVGGKLKKKKKKDKDMIDEGVMEANGNCDMKKRRGKTKDDNASPQDNHRRRRSDKVTTDGEDTPNARRRKEKKADTDELPKPRSARKNRKTSGEVMGNDFPTDDHSVDSSAYTFGQNSSRLSSPITFSTTPPSRRSSLRSTPILSGPPMFTDYRSSVLSPEAQATSEDSSADSDRDTPHLVTQHTTQHTAHQILEKLAGGDFDYGELVKVDLGTRMVAGTIVDRESLSIDDPHMLHNFPPVDPHATNHCYVKMFPTKTIRCFERSSISLLDVNVDKCDGIEEARRFLGQVVRSI